MGSLKPGSDGVQEVQDDFEVIMLGFCINSSTPGAYVAPIQEGLDLMFLFKPNKYSKVNEIITEILCNNGQCPII